MLELLKNWKKLSFIYLRDLINLLRFGRKAPLFAQCIIINPEDVGRAIKSKIPRGHSGKVWSGDWDLKTVNLEKYPKFKFCKRRFVDGESWEKIGAYKHVQKWIVSCGQHDECMTYSDIVERYEKVDVLYNEIRLTGLLKMRREINPRNFREEGGIYIHIGRHGNLIFGKGGWHRLAIAKILGIKKVPAQLGVVHKDALGTLSHFLPHRSNGV
jgi:hypothetical protein